MNAVQTLAALSQLLQDAFASLLSECQQSTLWVGSTAEAPLSTVTIRETAAAIVLAATGPLSELAQLKLQISQETVLIQGRWADSAEVAGYFRPGQFQSLIPLPCLVEPETAQIEMLPNGLTVQVTKLATPRSAKVHTLIGQPCAAAPAPIAESASRAEVYAVNKPRLASPSKLRQS